MSFVLHTCVPTYFVSGNLEIEQGQTLGKLTYVKCFFCLFLYVGAEIVVHQGK
jgi:hypothetical protein